MLWAHKRYDHLYNCSRESQAVWASFGTVNVPIGVAYLTTGVIYEVRACFKTDFKQISQTI